MRSGGLGGPVSVLITNILLRVRPLPQGLNLADLAAHDAGERFSDFAVFECPPILTTSSGSPEGMGWP